MPLRRSRVLGLLFAIVFAAFAFSWVDASLLRSRRLPSLVHQRELVVELGLTDLCLFTEARYTRHPSQADRHSAFMDHPLGLEHFPSGSLMAPPASLLRNHENLD